MPGWVIPSGTRLVADERNATKRPFGVVTAALEALSPWVPSAAVLTRSTCGAADAVVPVNATSKAAPKRHAAAPDMFPL